jgi:hypothetical protein
MQVTHAPPQLISGCDWDKVASALPVQLKNMQCFTS